MERTTKKLIKKLFYQLGFKISRINKSHDNHKFIQKNKLAIEKKNLLDNLFEILINQEYTPKVIYDVGAHKGTWTKKCAYYFPTAKYYLFEPQKFLKKDIEDNLKNLENKAIFSIGLGDLDGYSNFTIHKRLDSCSFIYSELEAKNDGHSQKSIPIFKLDTFVEKNNLPTPSILKIDAEGFDINVLNGAQRIIKNTEIIFIETGINNKIYSNSAYRIINLMEELGFFLFDVTDMNRPFTNKILWLCELVFVRKKGRLDKDYLLV